MKVIYEFNPDDYDSNDSNTLKLCQNSYKMYSALTDIQEYIRKLNKGWLDNDIEQIKDNISDFISESGIYDLQ